MIKNFKEIIYELKSQIPIQDLISEYISLKKSGRGYVGLCPFHSDKNPSLNIHPQKGIFKCFSCGAGGDLITFYSLINNKNWGEAIPELAIKYGIKIEYGDENKTENLIKNQLLEINKIALEHFKNNLFLQEGKNALSYLRENRKLKDETINNFEVGFALDGWDLLYKKLIKEYSFSQELLISSGLFIQRENNTLYDRFRNRIIFPIYDEKNILIAFGGRILPDDSTAQAKYINSPETILFNKSATLFGLNKAKEFIKKEDYAIITEGYLDVITSHEYGINTTVAPLGTALTVQQLKLLLKNLTSKKIYLCFDSDQAGINATEKIFKLDLSTNENLDLRVVPSLPKKDLDESLRSSDKDTILNLIFNGKKIIYFIIEKISEKYKNAIELENVIEKNICINEVIETLLSVKDLIERNEYLKYIAHKLNIDEEALRIRIVENSKQKRKQYFYKEKFKENKSEELFKMYTEERFKYAESELLLLYICHFPNVENIRLELESINFIDEKNKLIKDYLDSIEEKEISPQKVINNLLIEFNEFKHIMSYISEIAIKLEEELEDNSGSYLKNKEKILSEAKSTISWWVTNKQNIKDLTELLKNSKNEKEKSDILSKIMEEVKRTKKLGE